MSYDPLPPHDSVCDYARPKPPSRPSSSSSSILASFFRGLLPNYDPNAPEGEQPPRSVFDGFFSLHGKGVCPELRGRTRLSGRGAPAGTILGEPTDAVLAQYASNRGVSALIIISFGVFELFHCLFFFFPRMRKDLVVSYFFSFSTGVGRGVTEGGLADWRLL